MNVVKERRDALGLTQQDLANQVGCTTAHLSYIENGQRRPSVSLAKKIARVLHMEWQALFEEGEANA